MRIGIGQLANRRYYEKVNVPLSMSNMSHSKALLLSKKALAFCIPGRAVALPDFHMSLLTSATSFVISFCTSHYSLLYVDSKVVTTATGNPGSKSLSLSLQKFRKEVTVTITT